MAKEIIAFDQLDKTVQSFIIVGVCEKLKVYPKLETAPLVSLKAIFSAIGLVVITSGQYEGIVREVNNKAYEAESQLTRTEISIMDLLSSIDKCLNSDIEAIDKVIEINKLMRCQITST